MTKIIVTDHAQRRTHFTQIPNMIDDLGLDPYAHRLYVHLKRVAGDEGASWQSTKTLAQHCCMSAGSVSKAKKVLVSHGLITVEKKTYNGTKYDHIEIVDIWAKNAAKYEVGSLSEGTRSPDESARSPNETKKNPIEEEHKKNIEATPQSQSDNGADKAPPPDEPTEKQLSLGGMPTLKPTTPQEQLLFQLINKERRLKRYRRLTKFPSSVTKEYFGVAAAHFDNGALEGAIKKAIAARGMGLLKVVQYLKGWAEREAAGTPPPWEQQQERTTWYVED